jgi:sulfane dehydrogenase subunit SoxC
MARNRRKFLTLSAGVAALSSCGKDEPPPTGANMRPYGERAPQEKTQRTIRELTASPGTGSSRTPLQDLYGIITPSALHYERHHSGVPAIDPASHRLLVHGLVEKPLLFTVDDIKRLPLRLTDLLPRVRRQQRGRAGRQVP